MPQNHQAIAAISAQTRASDAEALAYAKTVTPELLAVVDAAYLPTPVYKILHNYDSDWLARCRWMPGEPNTTIELQRRICDDRPTLKRIIAHELCHHVHDLAIRAPLLARDPHEYARNERRETMYEKRGHEEYGAHGKIFQELAAKFNAAFGSGYVTKTSDKTITISDIPTYYVLIYKDKKTGVLYSAAASKPSARQKLFVDSKLALNHEAKRSETSAASLLYEYKLVTSQNPSFGLGKKIGDGASRPNDPELRSILDNLWNSAPALEGFGTVPHGVDAENQAKDATSGFYVLLAKKGDRIYWAQSSRLSAKQKVYVDRALVQSPYGQEVKFVRCPYGVLLSGTRIGDGMSYVPAGRSNADEVNNALADLWENGRELPGFGTATPNEATASPVGSELFLSIESYEQPYAPDVLRDAYDLVAEGGEVATETLRSGLQRCSAIVLARDTDGEAVGVVAIKRPLPSYSNSVFVKAGLGSSSGAAEELGYLYVSPEVRHRGLATDLVLTACSLAQGPLWATTREDNKAVLSIFTRAGFLRSGQPWASARGDYKLVLLTRGMVVEAAVDEQEADETLGSRVAPAPHVEPQATPGLYGRVNPRDNYGITRGGGQVERGPLDAQQPGAGRPVEFHISNPW